jgi:hypothetical protein
MVTGNGTATSVIASAAKQSGTPDRKARIASSSTPRNDGGGLNGYEK